jgi:hypothetical protein
MGARLRRREWVSENSRARENGMVCLIFGSAATLVLPPLGQELRNCGISVFLGLAVGVYTRELGRISHSVYRKGK